MVENASQECDQTDGHVFIKKEIVEERVNSLGLVAPDGTRKLSVCKLDSEPGDLPWDSTDKGATRLVDKLKIEKRKSTTLVINGCTTFCDIVTVNYRSEDRILKQHYISEVKGEVDGDIGLEPLDEILEVNGKELQNLPQAKVKKIFKNIKLRKSDSQLDLDLRVRRWVKDKESTDRDPVWTEVREIRIKLVLVPEEQVKRQRRKFRDFVKRVQVQRYRTRLSVHELEEITLDRQKLPRGNVDVNEVDEANKGLVKICNTTGQYLIWDHDGMLQAGVLTSETESSAMFMIETFCGRDTGPKPLTMEVFGVRFYYGKAADKTETKWFVHYDTDFDVSCKGFRDDAISTDDIDERCFLIRKDGAKTLLQSAVDRDRFLAHNPETGGFYMKEIDVQSLEKMMNGKTDTESDFENCWFEFEHLKVSHHNIVSMDTFFNLFACRTENSRRLMT